MIVFLVMGVGAKRCIPLSFESFVSFHIPLLFFFSSRLSLSAEKHDSFIIVKKIGLRYNSFFFGLEIMIIIIKI